MDWQTFGSVGDPLASHVETPIPAMTRYAGGVTMPLTIVCTGDEAGTISGGTNTVDFSETEALETGSAVDVIDPTGASNAGVSVQSEFGDRRITGSAGDDHLPGGDGADELYGGDGDDQIQGEAGNGALDGGAGSDDRWGGDGGDTITGGTGTDRFVHSDGDGVDRITDFGLADDDVDGCANDSSICPL